MNMLPLRQILINNGFPSKEIFVYNMPEAVERGVLLLHSLNGAKLDRYIPDYKRANFQAIVRASDFKSGYALSESVMAAFKVIKRYQQDDVFFHFIEPLHDPVAFPVSKGNFIEFSVNFRTTYIET